MPFTEKDREAIAAYKAARPYVKCAIDGCPYYRQDGWDAIHYTPAPQGWTCSHHEATVI